MFELCFIFYTNIFQFFSTNIFTEKKRFFIFPTNVCAKKKKLKTFSLLTRKTSPSIGIQYHQKMSSLSNPQSKIAATLRKEAIQEAMIERKAKHAAWLERQTTYRRGGARARSAQKAANQELVLRVSVAEQNGEWVTMTRGNKKLGTGSGPSSRSEVTPVCAKKQQKSGFKLLQDDDSDSDDSDSESTERGRDWKRGSNRGAFQSPVPSTRTSGSVVREEPSTKISWADVARDPAPSTTITSESVTRTLFSTSLKNGSWADEMESDEED